MTGTQFYVNTFSVEEYAAALPKRLPVALVLPVDRRLEMAYWVHRIQNEYSLNYINRLWGRCRQQAWPQEVRL